MSRKGVVKNIIIGVEITEPEIPYIFMHIFTVPILETICKTGGSRIDNFFFFFKWPNTSYGNKTNIGTRDQRMFNFCNGFPCGHNSLAHF